MLSHPISPIPSPPYQKIGSGMSPLNYEPVSPDYLPPPDSPPPPMAEQLSLLEDRYPEPPPKRRHPNALYPVLLEHVQHLRVGKLIFTDEATRLQRKMLVERGRTNFDFSQVPNYKMTEKKLEPCPLCNQSNCRGRYPPNAKHKGR
ncbi:hypothetical protein JTE90_028340 [Oedothorax gibbosus]|uniref:Uncharacterized protein n=1 Tax=Oedothorax gibbosus TaxID=931172 RepID=A0AAV6V2L8_9ARAC|nr:hypothetical protein JTE90_028340 [Oedothorax gibbosus]